MKNYIKGRKFDTATAKRVWTRNNGFGVNALNYTEETLYLKKSGVYFLFQKSGPLGKLAIKRGKENIGREIITPLTYKEALEWLLIRCHLKSLVNILISQLKIRLE